MVEEDIIDLLMMQDFTGVRIMETHENYNRQHQDLRTENGIAYGDVIEGVKF